jgi:ribosomal protein S6--L-glutamate ligase
MNICILGPKEKSIRYSTRRLLEEAKKDFKVDLVPASKVKLKITNGIDVSYNEKSFRNYEYVLPRIDSKRARVGYPIVRFLDDMGINKPYVADTILIAHNKFTTLQELVKNGVPVPETYMTGSKHSAMEIMKDMDTPLILKLLGGFGGQGVVLADSKDVAESIVDTMNILKQEILIEKYIPNSGEDIRAIVAGNDIIASFKRVATVGEFRANIKAGGRGVSFKLTEEMKEIALKSAKAIKSKLCAIDMIQSRTGQLNVIEVNINPGLKGIEKATNVNVARLMIEFIKNEIKR